MSRWFRCVTHTLLAAAVGGFFSADRAFAADESAERPAWVAEVPALASGGDRAFSFHTNVDFSGFHLLIYTSWAPPDRRAMIFCDSADGVPMMVAIDGDAYLYDLVGGQIVHFQSEPRYELRIEGDRLQFAWGIHRHDEGAKIVIDLASVVKPLTEFKTTATDTTRTISGSTARGSRAMLQATLSEPPLPTEFGLFVMTGDTPGHVTCDSFHYGYPLPAWHHPMDVTKLMKSVPYLDAANMKDVPEDRQKRLEITDELLAGETTFLLRPALRDPALRQKLEQAAPKLNFAEMETHEKLLKKAWLKALAEQQIELGK